MSTFDVSYNELLRMMDLHEKQYEVLVLNGNYLRYIPFDMIPASVKHLSLDINDLTNLEIDVPLPNLQTLSLDTNRLRHMDILIPMPSLHTLNLRKNCLSDINGLAFALPSLKHLYLSYNELEVIQALPSTLETLNVNFCHLKLFPSRLPSTLQELTAVGNRLKMGGLPMNWGTNLRVLDLTNNSLKEFPKRLPDSLEKLSLSRNQIESIPSKLPSNLKILNLFDNKIRCLPTHTNVRLQILFAGNNQLTQDFSKIPVSWARDVFQSPNWNEERHQNSQIKMKRCWKRFLLKKRLRQIGRTRRITEELLMVALHPDRVIQTDVLSSEWSRQASTIAR
jgi:Leucine-rich repeat (LRR) protein